MHSLTTSESDSIQKSCDNKVRLPKDVIEIALQMQNELGTKLGSAGLASAIAIMVRRYYRQHLQPDGMAEVGLPEPSSDGNGNNNSNAFTFFEGDR